MDRRTFLETTFVLAGSALIGGKPERASKAFALQVAQFAQPVRAEQ